MCADIWYLGLLTILGEVHLDKVYGGDAGTVSICMYQDMSLCICVCQRDLGRTLWALWVTGGGSDCTCARVSAFVG